MAAARGGGARRLSSSAASARERRNRRRRELRLQRKREREEEQQQQPEEADDDDPDSSSDPPPSPATLLPLLASAAASSLRFLADHDLLLLPSQTLSLESALSRLRSLLLEPPFPPPPPPPPSTAATTGGGGPGREVGRCWFLRFLASTASDGSDPRWVEAFRMSRPSFYLLLQTLAPSLSPHPSSSSPSPSPSPPLDHKLGAALFRLAHAAPFRTVARRFGLVGGPPAACRAFYEVCRSVVGGLGHLFELPSDAERVAQGFRWAVSLPNCGGVLGFPRFGAGSGSGSGDGGVMAQVVVDSEGRFLDVSAGWPGSIPPAQILPRTQLFSAQANALASVTGGHDGNGVPGSSLPRYFLGGSYCPLLPWLLTPFPDSDNSEDDPSRRVFNEVHARGMELAEKAVGAVRARWRLLLVRWSAECREALPFVIVVSCLLHNFLFKCSELVADDEVFELTGEERFPDFEGKGDEVGESVREDLAAHLYSVSQKGLS
uniref:Putative nuclease HARBI1 n=1 Tax=Anthurium amnicola TaxID=1678845 RepID=A0A1D1ZE50_9ARAE